VFNLVTGVGPVVGEAIAAHADVDMVSFTGSTRAGKRVAEVAAQTVKKVSLELGGKSPNVILDDADLTKAVADGVGKCFLNSGQTCTALTRMIVPRDRLAEVEQIAAATAAAFTPGDPFGAGTRLGPLVSAAQRDRVRGFIQTGIDEGATLVAGGTAAPEGLEQGYFVQPTVFSNVTPDMTIAREEIFARCCRSSPTTPRTRPSASPTTPSTAWPAGCGAATPSGPSRWPAESVPGR
jgi:acyl-CoA reductase-like NAD-dependent aldehyde dehydrogenase